MSSPLFNQTSENSKFAIHMSTLNDLKEFGLKFFMMKNSAEFVKFAEHELTRLLIATKSRVVLRLDS